MDAFEWALQATELGAGELMVTSIDREGSGNGFDLDLIRRIATTVPIPVIACGGAGNLQHIQEVISDGAADAVSVASIVHYECLDKFVYEDDEFSTEGNIEFLRGRTRSSRIPGVTIKEIKNHLISCGIECRPVERENVGV